MSEKVLQQKIMKFCNKFSNLIVYKFASPSKRGVPDLLIVSAGRCLFIEVKNPNGNGKVSALQEKELKRLNGVGVPACVVDDLARAEEIISVWVSTLEVLSDRSANTEDIARLRQ